MTVDLQELLLGNQASILASAAQAHVQTMDWHDRASIKKFDEVGGLEAAASRNAAKSGADYPTTPGSEARGV